MDMPIFIQHLLRELASTGSHKETRKYIIRFRRSAEFGKFHELLRYGSKDVRNGLSHVESLGIIGAFACPLSSPDVLSRFGKAVTIEGDVRISVHGLPTSDVPEEERAELAGRQPAAQSPEEARIRNSGEHGTILPWGVKQLRAPQTWTLSQGTGIRIGVIDTGADFFHPDLRPVLARGINMVNPLILPLDDNGHGTHISGTIAAAGGLGGLTGMAPGAKIYPVKAFDSHGSAFVSDIIYGIDWCVRQGMHIINMSFGMKRRSEALLAAVRNAHRRGVLIVASSGNDGKQATLDYPARFTETIAVGAVDRKNRIAPFSNRGKRVDVYAPGEHIESTWLRGRYQLMSGTSMATSHVSGLIALLLAAKPNLSISQVRMLLKQSAVKPRTAKPARVRRPGQLDAVRLLKLAGVKRQAVR